MREGPRLVPWRWACRCISYYLYFIFIAGDPTADAATGPRNWSQSAAGAFPGPYADGTAWVLVYNNNYNDTLVRHSDHAFRVFP